MFLLQYARFDKDGRESEEEICENELHRFRMIESLNVSKQLLHTSNYEQTKT